MSGKRLTLMNGPIRPTGTVAAFHVTRGGVPRVPDCLNLSKRPVLSRHGSTTNVDPVHLEQGRLVAERTRDNDRDPASLVRRGPVFVWREYEFWVRPAHTLHLLQQIAAVNGALHNVAIGLLDEHFGYCVANAAAAGDQNEAR